MKLIIAAPANGMELKNALQARLAADPRISQLRDMSDPNAGYPQLSFAVAQAIAAGEADRAILICGTGIGTAIAANKVSGIRAATAHDLTSVRGANPVHGAKRHRRPCRMGIGGHLAQPAPRRTQQLRPQSARNQRV